MKHITKADIEEVLPKIPKDGMNISCCYTNKRGDHCLVGEILDKLNLEFPKSGSFMNTETFKNLAAESGRYYWKMDRDAVEFLHSAQYYADHDNKWGDCLKMAADDQQKQQ